MGPKLHFWGPGPFKTATGDALKHGLHGPFYLFRHFELLLISGHAQTYVFLLPPIYYFGQLPRLFASNQVAQCFCSTCFHAIFACIHPLGFQFHNNLFSTLVQPFVFDFWPRPGCKIPMLKPCSPNNMVSCFRASPVPPQSLFLLLFLPVFNRLYVMAM